MSVTGFTLLLIAVMASVASLSFAHNSAPILQDFCVAVNKSEPSVIESGKICKDPKTVTPNNFYFSGLNVPRNVTSPVGTKVTPVFVEELPGLSTLGVSLSRVDFVPQGLNAPHLHPHASEIFLVLEGTLYAGFIGSNPLTTLGRNKFYSKVLYPGDVFVFPKGLIHFQYNIGESKAVAFASFGHESPGVLTIGNALFGSDPLIWPEVIAKGLKLETYEVTRVQAKNWTENV